MTAVIITGNPELIDGNARAEAFYGELAAFLEAQGYRVSRDPGAPFTEPPAADLWIGHSRGADRLRFAPSGTRTIGIGVPAGEESAPFPIVNHPDDALANRTFRAGAPMAPQEDGIDDAHHYVLDEGMKARLIELLK